MTYLLHHDFVSFYELNRVGEQIIISDIQFFVLEHGGVDEWANQNYGSQNRELIIGLFDWTYPRDRHSCQVPC